MENGNFKSFVEIRVSEAIDAVFTEAHEWAATNSGDITPEQRERLDKIQEDLTKLIIEQVAQNIGVSPEIKVSPKYGSEYKIELGAIMCRPIGATSEDEWYEVDFDAAFSEIKASDIEKSELEEFEDEMVLLFGREVLIENIDHFKNFPPQEPKEYNIEVCRTGWGTRTITVMACSQEEAEEKALDEAGDHEFTEKDADYKIV